MSARCAEISFNTARTASSGNGRIAPISSAMLLLHTIPESSGDTFSGSVSSLGEGSLPSRNNNQRALGVACAAHREASRRAARSSTSSSLLISRTRSCHTFEADRHIAISCCGLLRKPVDPDGKLWNGTRKRVDQKTGQGSLARKASVAIVLGGAVSIPDPYSPPVLGGAVSIPDPYSPPSWLPFRSSQTRASHEHRDCPGKGRRGYEHQGW